MANTLIERLPHVLSQGRRKAHRLIDAVSGRYRERAVLQEIVRASHDCSSDPHARRLIAGDPTSSLAALLAEHVAGASIALHTAWFDLPDARAGEGLDVRIAEWIPRVLLLRALAPGCALRLRMAGDDAPALRLVFDALLEPAEFRGISHGWLHYDTSLVPPRDGTTLLLADDATHLSVLAGPRMPWIACIATPEGREHARRALVQRGDTTFAIETVGTTPGEWARRHVGDNPVAAMHAALGAFGAMPLAQTSAGTTPSGRRRAGMEVLLGECVREGARTLVWVDAPDRRTGDATLCRAIMKRDAGAPPWERVVVLGWHFAPTFAQHLALRCDSRVEALAIRMSSRAPGGHGASCVHAEGFHPVGGLASAWIDRKRSASARDHEWLSVQLRDDGAIADWSIDPRHDGEVFRGTWHAARDAQPGVRSVRLRVPWCDGPRRVCVRATDAAGQVSELLSVVRHRAETHRVATPSTRSACTAVEALC